MDKPKPKRTKLPSIQETIHSRNPLNRVAITPVDPYAVPPPPPAESSTDDSPTEPSESRGQGAATPPARGAKTPEEESTGKANDPVIAYGTYLRASQRMGIKMRSVLSGRDSYEIVQDAIDEYFDRHPLDS